MVLRPDMYTDRDVQGLASGFSLIRPYRSGIFGTQIGVRKLESEHHNASHARNEYYQIGDIPDLIHPDR